MNILFLTLAYPITGQNLYTDMVDELANHGHSITVCTQDETKSFGPLSLSYKGKVCVLSIPTGKITQTTFVKKGINTLLLEYRFLQKMAKINFKNMDVLLYSTPPITFQNIIKMLKRKHNCINYLLLKDIFPQNAVDLGIIKEKSILYSFFRNKEKKLYQYSDIIGCLSPGNIKYLVEHNPEIAHKEIHIAPNCIFLSKKLEIIDKNKILEQYNIPENAIHFVYGGNLGKPQGIDFILKCIDMVKGDKNIFIAIIGNGTEYNKINTYLMFNKIKNVRLINYLPKNEYLELLACMDIGLIFLDNRFTIPNFPSRILDYMNFSMPIIACTDIVCDVKQEICDQGAGFWCRSDDSEAFKQIIENIKENKKEICETIGKRSRELLIEKYSVQHVVEDMLIKINEVR